MSMIATLTVMVNLMEDRTVSKDMFELVIEDEEKLAACQYFVTGFHGLGSVGYIATKHLLDELKAERVAIIKSKASPSFIYLEDGRIVMPFELYCVRDVLLFLPRLPPYRHAETDFAEALVEWVVGQQFKQAFLVGGVDKSLQDDESFIRYVPTRRFLDGREEDSPYRKHMLATGLMIQGPLAMMLGLLDLEQFAALGVLAFAERERPDPVGAAKAIEVLNELLGLECSTEELLKNAQIYEDELRKLPGQEEPGSGPPETYT